MIEEGDAAFEAAVQAAIAKRGLIPPDGPSRGEVEQMIDSRLDSLRVTGPTVTGSARSGWLVNATAGGGQVQQPLPEETFIVDRNGTAQFWKFNAQFDSDV